MYKKTLREKMYLHIRFKILKEDPSCFPSSAATFIKFVLLPIKCIKSTIARKKFNFY